jgi:hypothetical protein
MAFCYDAGIPHSQFLSWPLEDRAKMLAFMADKGTACNLCGSSRWEWENNPYAYEAAVDVCPGCAKKDEAREEKMPAGGTMILVPPAAAAKMREDRLTKRSIVQQRRAQRTRR